MRLGVLEVTKHFPDGHTETEKVQIHPSDLQMSDRWFEVDRQWYFWAKGTKFGIEVVYAPTNRPYKKMTAILVGGKL